MRGLQGGEEVVGSWGSNALPGQKYEKKAEQETEKQREGGRTTNAFQRSKPGRENPIGKHRSSGAAPGPNSVVGHFGIW